MSRDLRRLGSPTHLLLGLACTLSFVASARAGFVTFSAGGDATPASISSSVDAFRAALGDPNNGNNPGPLASGRREINWDGGGATTAASSGATLTVFTNNRGATFVTPGTGFLQTPLTDPLLTGIEPTYATAFGTFSAQRIFTPLGSNITDATFSVPGSAGAVAATVAGFGAVFTDVDLTNTTQLEFFNVDGDSILTLHAAPDSVVDGGLSFIGAVANAGERIARVRITTGNSALGPVDTNGNPDDLVAMDDFIYAEPVAVPEPTNLALLLTALAFGIGVRLFRAKRGN